MKIGILTFSRTHNFGAILQCYALQETLKKLGAEVYVIDYRQPYIESTNRPFLWFEFVKRLFKPRSLYHYLKGIKGRTDGERKFHDFKVNFLNCTKPYRGKEIPPDFDVYIIGSDQVWSTECTQGYDPILWGDFKRQQNSKLFAYAISSNAKSIYGVADERWQTILNRFDGLSFREKSIADMIVPKTNKSISICLDPTLLVGRNIWDRVVDTKWEKENYILVYEARYLQGQEFTLRKYAQDLAKKKKCKVISRLYDYTPGDFVSLFKYANYVITSSFHGTVFGLIYNKPMTVIQLNDGHDGRYINLLKSVGAENALISITDPFSEKKINYEIVNQRIEELRKSSINYLNAIVLTKGV
ncbi:MAG: polysaccharide pyruvyl transferase family protein [Prevotella sp.]|nr:polysaccharide pyruvyl transferase family protein [Prevotella sp.]